MKPSAFTVMGVTAPSARLTRLGAALLAIVIAVPGGVVIGLIGWCL
ncbi:hypothetical protein [Rubellimicrobium rubrum]|nr:hypothetical protein [Rubellimicrobium rubrum]